MARKQLCHIKVTINKKFDTSLNRPSHSIILGNVDGTIFGTTVVDKLEQNVEPVLHSITVAEMKVLRNGDIRISTKKSYAGFFKFS